MTTAALRPPRLSAGGVVRSEYLKLRTLRSTWWCSAIVFVLVVGVSALLTAVSQPNGSPIPADGQHEFQVQAATVGFGFGQLVAAVLGSLVITGEYGTGMIRSTLAAVPGRYAVIFTKALVLAIWLFVLGLISVLVAAVIDLPLLPNLGITSDLGEPRVWGALVGAAGYLALTGLLSFTLGLIIRNTAGTIAISLGLVFVLPTVVGIIGAVAKADWANNLEAFLPSSAGARMYSYVTANAPQSTGGVITLDPLQGFLVLAAWIVVFGIVATVLFKRRDV